eukprot:CAMPEP_0194540352 /NCGR_PEP_ID=MMETSP0253-20130528/80521_1 /TAXON_ID=2966 /ORGANISM="Noctiluca scintillans" /LENGTH=65 /DNA_ID=CAMNT_0039386715 /DNA_START=483 /DNA_END=680 /DNA_ORIENTATION=-
MEGLGGGIFGKENGSPWGGAVVRVVSGLDVGCAGKGGAKESSGGGSGIASGICMVFSPAASRAAV